MDWKNIIKSDYKGYKVDIPDLPIKLSRNENPYDIPLYIKEEVLKKLAETPWNRYPDGSAKKLKNKLSNFLGINPENLLLGTGSGEVIQIIFNGLLREEDEVVLPIPTFPLYEKLLQQKKVRIIKIYLNEEDFSLDFEKLRETFKNNPKLLILTNPNNPTGNFLIKERDLEKIADFSGFILIDEAYFEFSGLTFLPYINQLPNLLILRTFSKAFSSAGVRLGYLITNSKVVEYLDNFRLPYNLNIFSQIAGEILLSYWDHLKEKIDIIKREKERVYNKMKTMDKIIVYPSVTNFILFRSDKKDEILKKCEEYGISLRDFSKEPHLENCLRVSIGDKKENDLFLKILREVLL